MAYIILESAPSNRARATVPRQQYNTMPDFFVHNSRYHFILGSPERRRTAIQQGSSTMHRIRRVTPIVIVAASATDAFVTSSSKAHYTPLPSTRAANDFVTAGNISGRASHKFEINSDGEASVGEFEFNEFVTVNESCRQLEILAKEDRIFTEEAEQESRHQEQAALPAEMRSELLDGRDPTVSDKMLSMLPYLFPLIDGLQYGRFLLGAGDMTTNPFVASLSPLYSMVQSVPLLGVFPFLALNHVSEKSSLDRLVRFNAQQAIFLEIALMFPSMVIRLDKLVLGGAGVPVSQFSEATFGALLLTLLYCAGSSLSGKEPDGIPLISKAVRDRMSTIETSHDVRGFLNTRVSRG